jgi:broad specificity phosphatase PhoE
LDETGLEQARRAGGRIARDWPVAAIYSSPLSRARKTAEAIGSRLGLPVQVQQGLIDIDFGEWQGLTREEARQRWPESVDAWFAAPQTVQTPSGESLDVLRARAMAAIQDITSRHDGDIVVAVAHTAVNRAILLGILGLGNDRFWRLAQDTCAINVFEAQAGDFTLVSMNDTCHLKDVL